MSTRGASGMAHILWRMLLVAALWVALAAPAGLAGPPASYEREDAAGGAPTRVIVRLRGSPLLAHPANQVAVQAQQMASTQSVFAQALLERLPQTAIEYTYQVAFHGAALRVPAADAAALDALRALPGVEAVFEELAYEPALYETLDALGAPALWTKVGGRSHAGESVRVALLDSGIASAHPMFDPSGLAYPPGFPKGDPAAVTPKVIVARAFFRPGDPPLPGDETPLPGPNGSGHGTHLAGIVAGVPISATWPSGAGEISGLAPRAQLMNYRLFYPSASGGPERAYTGEILLAIEQAILDGADIILAAWSSMASRLPYATPEAEALAAAMDAGIVVVTAAGNDGPAYGSASRLPGGIPRVITVGAQGQPYGKALFGPVIITTRLGPLELRDVSAVAGNGSPTACAPLPANSLTGKAALIMRGGCPFADKAYHAQQAGAALALISNTQDSVTEMACTGAHCGAGVITIPTAMISLGLGSTLREWLASSSPVTPTLTLDPVGRVVSHNPAWVSPSSGRGPAFASWLKPDLLAPGQAVISAYYDGSDPSRQFAPLSGSSVAAAHAAGAAALLKQQHPDWDHDRVRAALMASARLEDADGAPSPLSILDSGAGMLDLARLAEATLSFHPPSLSLAHLLAGEAREIEMAVSDARTSGAAREFAVSLESDTALQWMAPITLTLQPGETVSITLQLTVTPSALSGDKQALLTLTETNGAPPADGERVHLPIWAHVSLPPQPATVLLLDNDSSGFAPNPDYAPFVKAALEQAGVDYAVWDADIRFGQAQTVPDPELLARYDVVLWLTGDNIYPDGTFQMSTPLTAIDQQILAAYLDQGGRLLALGQNLAQASDVNPDPDSTWGRSGLYHHYLGAHWLQGALYGAGGYPPSQAASVQPLPGSFLQGVRLDLGNVGDGDGNQSSIDEIAPGGLPDGSDADLVQPVLFATGASPVGAGYVALAKAGEPSLERPNPGVPYRSLYFAFGLEGINNNTGYTTRAELLRRSLDWLRDEVNVTLASPAVGGPHRPVTLSCEATSSLGAAMQGYRWRVGSGDGARVFTSAGPQVQVSFDEHGVYPVMVEATDALGHRAIAQGEVHIVAGGASQLTAQPARVRAGEGITYTVRAINTDPLTLTMAFTLPLPAGVTYAGHSGADYASDALTWQGPLAPGQGVTATLTVTAPHLSGSRLEVVAVAEFATDGWRFERAVTTQVYTLYHITLPIIGKEWTSP